MLQAGQQSDDSAEVAGHSRRANASLVPHHRPRTAQNRLPPKTKSFKKSALRRKSHPNFFKVAPGNGRHAGTLGHLLIGDFGHGGPAAGSVGVLATTLFAASAASIWRGDDRPFAF
jgi:hypothetical protein